MHLSLMVSGCVNEWVVRMDAIPRLCLEHHDTYTKQDRRFVVADAFLRLYQNVLSVVTPRLLRYHNYRKHAKGVIFSAGAGTLHAVCCMHVLWGTYRMHRRRRFLCTSTQKSPSNHASITLATDMTQCLIHFLSLRNGSISEAFHCENRLNRS